jgi:ABC-2 type transport system ATP-binding protein
MSRVRAAFAVALTAVLAPAAAAHAQDGTVTSFDGTPITIHAFPAPGGAAAPTVLNGPGWSQSGANDPATGVVKQLNDLGYNVVTWDPRGFGTSGGIVSIDTPAIEGRDTSAIVDWVAQQPWSLNDGANDPRIGMAGGSYGGGIQYSTAIADHRLDALVPVVGWHSLRTALYKDDTFKQGWDTLLYGSGLGAANAVAPGLDPHITSAYEQGSKTGVLSAADEQWFVARGPGDTVSKITTPTMVVGGTVDTLFPLDEDVKLYDAIKKSGAPVKMVWFCGGHGTCLTGTGDPGQHSATLALGSQHLTDLTAAWFAKYLKKDASANTGPGFEWLADDAKWRSAPQWPAPKGKAVLAHGKGTLKLVKGYQKDAAGKEGNPMAATPAKAGQALQVPIKLMRAAQLVGAPGLTLTYSGKGTPAKGAKVYAQIVDVKRKIVVGNQVTPIPLQLDGKRHTVSRVLTPIAASAVKGTRYTLQIVSSSKVWAPQRGTGTIHVSMAGLTLPVVEAG